MPQETTGAMISVRDLLRVMFRQKWRVALTFLVVVILTALSLMFGPRKYASEAKLYMRVGRETMSLDPTATTGKNMSVVNTREYEIQSATDMLTSRVLLERVVGAIGAAPILQQRMPGERVEQPTEARGLFSELSRWKELISQRLDSMEITSDEQAILRLSQWIDVRVEKQSSVIAITCRCGSPYLSQAIVKQLVAEFQLEHGKMHRTSGSKDFFEEQSKVLYEQMMTASEQLRDQKNQVGLVSVEVQRKIIEQEVSNLNVEMARTSSSLAVAQDKIESLTENNPELMTVLHDATQQKSSGLSSLAIDSMRQQLYTLQLSDQELASRFLENHPQRRAVREQVAEARKILNQQELLMLVSDAAASRAQLESLGTKYAEAQQKLQKLNGDEALVEEAERELARLKTSHQQYVENLEVARIDEALMEREISNVNVHQAASFQAKPVSPKKSLVALLGLLAACCGAVAVAFVSELLDPTLKTADEAESQLGIPVLVSIPRMERHHVTLN